MWFGPGWLFKREDQISLFPRETKVLSPPEAAVQGRRAVADAGKNKAAARRTGRP
jgi:hypothetical protein